MTGGLAASRFRTGTGAALTMSASRAEPFTVVGSLTLLSWQTVLVGGGGKTFCASFARATMIW